jgi:UMF1 family MFS transporter
VLVGLFPIFFDKYWAAALPGTTSTFYLGLTNSSAAFIVMLIAPWLGALADRRGEKKLLVRLWTGDRRPGHGAAGADRRRSLVLALIVFALGSMGFFAGSSFQDALIVQVADRRETNRVSSLGFALGYLGGGLLFLFNVLMVQVSALVSYRQHQPGAIRIAFVDVAVWWIAFSLPLFRLVREAPADRQQHRLA